MTEYDPNLVPWLRAAQERGGKGTVELDARSIGRVADRIEALEAKVKAQSEYIMTANRVNNNLKKQVEEG